MAITKRKGIYWIDYYFRDDAGRQHRKREAVGACRKLAEELLKKRLAEVAEQRFFPERKKVLVKFSDARDSFIEWSKSNVGALSQVRYRISMDNLNAAFGHLHLNEVTPALAEKFKATRLKEVMPATVNRDLATLKHLYNLILKGRLLPDATIDPLLPARISLLRENNKRLRYLSEREFDELLLACDRLHVKRRPITDIHAVEMKPLIIAAVHTGMRRGELLNLKWCDIDLDGRVITIHEAKCGSARHVPINGDLHETLKAMGHRIDSSYVFAHREHVRYTGRRFKDIKLSWEAVVKEAGIVNFHFHDLRHTCASWLVQRGVPLKTVQEILGHKSFQTTLRYAHLAPELRIDAVEKLCKKKNDGHILDTKHPSFEGRALRPAANDGTTRTSNAGDRTRTGNLRLMKPSL